MMNAIDVYVLSVILFVLSIIGFMVITTARLNRLERIVFEKANPEVQE